MSNKQQNHKARNVGSRTATNRYYCIYLTRRSILREVGTRVSQGSWIYSHQKPTETILSEKGIIGRKSGIHKVDEEAEREPGLDKRQDQGTLWRTREWKEAWLLPR